MNLKGKVKGGGREYIYIYMRAMGAQVSVRMGYGLIRI